MNPKLQIAVVGPTGVVGREMVAALQERGVAPEQVTLLGSDRAEGEELDYLDGSLGVERATPESFRGMGLVLLATPPEVSRQLAPAAQAAGAWVVDVSEAFRGQASVPMVMPGVNEEVLERGFSGRIVTVPTVVTFALAGALEPLRRAVGVRQVHLTALLGASLAGKRGIDELEQQVAVLLSGKEHEPQVFPQRLAFNVVPQVGDFQDGSSAEERGWQQGLSRLWPAEALPRVSGTALQVPTFYGAFLTVTAQLVEPTSLEQVRALWKAAPLLKVLDVPEEKVYPMPMLVTADPTVHVGRLRSVPGAADWVTFVVAVDNAGRGAALTAVEVGDRLTRVDA